MENKANTANTPNPPNATPTNPTSLSLLKRVIKAFLLTTVLLAGYIWLHIPFSYLDASGAATTSISYWYDIIVTWLIAVIAALVIGRISASRWPRLVLLLISSLILLTFILSCAELDYRKTNPEWIGVVQPFSWIEPFKDGGIPSDLSDTIVSENFSEWGIAFSFLTAANTLRELNWYWIVVPSVDTRYMFPGWLPIIELNFIFSIALTLVGGTTAVIATVLHDIAKSLEFTNRILERISTPIATMLQNLVRPLAPPIQAFKRKVQEFTSLIATTLQSIVRQLYCSIQALKKKVTKSERPYTPPYRARRWSSRQKRLAWGTVIVVILTSLTLFTSATLANTRIPDLTWETESIYIPSRPAVRALLPLDNGTLLAGTDEGVFRSHNGGRSWASVGLTNMAVGAVRALALEPQEGTLFAGTSGGYFARMMGGTVGKRLVLAWQAASDGLTDMKVLMLALEPQEGTSF